MTDIARLVDTSIFVDYLRGNEMAGEWVNGFPKGELAYSVITAARTACRMPRPPRARDCGEGSCPLSDDLYIGRDLRHRVGMVSPVPFESRRRFSRLLDWGKRSSLWAYSMHAEREAFSSFRRSKS